MLVRLFFKRIIKEPVASRYLMLLQDNMARERYLQIYIGDKEGETVASWEKNIVPPRPMTYDLIAEILSLSNNVVLEKILIDGCNQDVFYAKMYFNVNGMEKMIDCRPSDAIAIGLKMDVPIYAESCVLDKHGIVIL